MRSNDISHILILFSLWNDYIGAITSAFPNLITVSRYVNLKLFHDPKQSNNESFSDYYTSVVDLY